MTWGMNGDIEKRGQAMSDEAKNNVIREYVVRYQAKQEVEVLRRRLRQVGHSLQTIAVQLDADAAQVRDLIGQYEAATSAARRLAGDLASMGIVL